MVYLLLRLPGENKVPRLRDQDNKNLIFCHLILVPRPRDDNEDWETRLREIVHKSVSRRTVFRQPAPRKRGNGILLFILKVV
jgi:hypothetical protein